MPPAAPPVFPAPPAAGHFLAGRAPADTAAAENSLMRVLDSLLAAPPAPADLFKLLEEIRRPLTRIEEERAGHYHNKPLPLGEYEENCFQQVVSAWRKLARGYALCLPREKPDTADPQSARQVAGIVHRCLDYHGRLILEHYRARRELPAGAWLDLHGAYEMAEDRGVALTPLAAEGEHDGRPAHCTAAYVGVLLVSMANPYGQGVRDIELIRRWALLWAPLVTLLGLSPGGPPAYVLELKKDEALQLAAAEGGYGADARRLDTAALSVQVGRTLAELKNKVPPSRLGLGEENFVYVAQLLAQIARPWRQAAASRRFRRFAATGTARLCTGFEAMHFHISGKEFERPDSAAACSRNEFDNLFTFRDLIDSPLPRNRRPHADFPPDEWLVTNHSANGFRLARSAVGQKMAHGQLLAVCPHDGDSFLLAQATWLMQEQGGGLIAGISVLPGRPVAVAARVAGGAGGAGDQFMRAFLLPALPAVREEASLVAPAGVYRASLVLDLYDGDGKRQIRLKSVLQRGVDFGRVSFAAL